MLLFRRCVDLSAEADGVKTITPLTISVYREKIDSGYQDLVQRMAEDGLFDLFFLYQMENVLKSGTLVFSINHLFIPIPLGHANFNYSFGVQNETTRFTSPPDGIGDILGSVQRSRLTSFTTGHFLDLYM